MKFYPSGENFTKALLVMLVTNFMSADEYVRWIDHNTYIILIHQSYRITRMYKWEHEWSTSYLYFHALTHTHSAHCVYELPACHTIMWARTQKLILITTEVLPENSKRSMTFTVARITEYFKNANYADLNIVGGCLFCPVLSENPSQNS